MTTPMRLITLHGRRDPNETMEDWGFNGPIIENIVAVHYTYGSPVVYFLSVKDKLIAQEATGWEEWDEDALEMPMHRGMLYLIDDEGEAFFGDWEFQRRGGHVLPNEPRGKSMFNDITHFNRLREVYADSDRGIYIPQYFAESLNRNWIAWNEMSQNQSDFIADFDRLLRGPDVDPDEYWEIWNAVEDNLVLRVPSPYSPNGVYARLYQDGDLFIEFDIERNWDIPTVRSSLVAAYLDQLRQEDPDAVLELAAEHLLNENRLDEDQVRELITETFYAG